MALTVIVKATNKQTVQSQPYGTVWIEQVAQVQFDSSYPSGGYPVTPSLFNMNGIFGMFPLGQGGNTTPTVMYFDTANTTLRVFGVSATPSVAGVPTGITTTVSSLIEVPVGAAGLSGVSPTFLVVGF